jgi:hypothetical protein
MQKQINITPMIPRDTPSKGMEEAVSRSVTEDTYPVIITTAAHRIIPIPNLI